jgi:hypothetical protein
MGRAEKKLKAREQQAASQRARTEADAQARLRAAEEDDLSRVRRLVPQVLKAMERDDYRWAGLVTFEKKTLFGGFKRTQVAGVHVCSFSFDYRGETTTGSISLLRDGRFVRSGAGGSGIFELSEAREAAKYSRHGVRIAGGSTLNVRDIADGLQTLVQRYG